MHLTITDRRYQRIRKKNDRREFQKSFIKTLLEIFNIGLIRKKTENYRSGEILNNIQNV